MLKIKSLEIKSDGKITRVILNGDDISKGVTNIEYKHYGGCNPVLNIETKLEQSDKVVIENKKEENK